MAIKNKIKAVVSKIKQIVLLLFIIASIGCKNQKNGLQREIFEPKLIAIFVEDIERSINWYIINLGFEIEKEIQTYPDYGLKIAFIQLGGFHLEIIEKINSYKQSEVLPNSKTMLGGVFKIGFALNDLDKKYNQLKEKEDVEFIAELGNLPKSSIPIAWPTKHFIIQDPDGNYIQFFNSNDYNKVTPWLFMITVDDIEKSTKWYSENLGFKHHITIGEAGNRRAILERNNYVLELFSPEKVIKPDEISEDSTILGYKKIAFGVGELALLSAKLIADEAEIVMPLGQTDFEWAKQAMITKDLEGNWTQLFEIK